MSFIDTMLQFSLVGAKQRGLMLPTRIRKVTVDPAVLHDNVTVEEDVKKVPVSIFYHNLLFSFMAFS